MSLKLHIVRPFFRNNSRFISSWNSLSNHSSKIINHTAIHQNVVENHAGLWIRSLSTSSVHRSASTPSSDKPSRRLPMLMDFPQIVWPSIIKTIKNYIMVHLIIRPYFDPDFTIQDFIDGSKQALSIISNTISTGTDFDSLRGLVTEDAIKEIKASVAKMSMAQRTELSVAKEDIYFSFPYQVGVMFEEDGDVQKRWVEITMVYHILRNAKEMQERQEELSMNIASNPEYQQKFSICNYRFIKEFTTNAHSDWIVNIASHFKPVDMHAKRDDSS